jgi:carbonic anhydrase
MKSMLARFIATATLFGSVAIVAQETGQHTHWAYDGKDGPNKWSTLDPAYSECKLGHHQSPINIRHTEKADLPPIQFDYHASPLTIIDNGHTVMVNYVPGSFITVGDHRYQLTQFHFHHPSEEHIYGKGSDMVIHLVHSDASGDLAVVAVLLKPERSTQRCRPCGIICQRRRIRWPQSKGFRLTRLICCQSIIATIRLSGR